MASYGEAVYGERISDAYDDLYGDFHPSEAQIEVLAAYAGDGLAVEIGAGTGRVTIPLARRGVRIIGVDSAPSMANTLRSKAGGLVVDSVHANAAEYRAPEEAALVFAVFNTFFLMADEVVQEQFIARAAEMLAVGGRLVLETFVPHPGRLPDGPHPGILPEHSDVVVKRWIPDGVVLFAARNTPEERRFDYHEIVLRDGEPARLLPGRMRYMWPEEIDSVALRYGLQLEHRWADWDQGSFLRGSRKHVSVYTA